MKKQNRKNYSLMALETVSTGVLHDMASPMTAISLSADRMKKREQRGYRIDGDIRVIEKAAETMREMMSTTRQAFRPSNEKETIFDISKEIQKICTMCKPRIEANAIKLILSRKAENSYVRGRRIRFQQIMLNLISNTIEAFGGRLAETRKCIIISMYANKKQVNVKVKDNGVGIPRHMSKQIFRPFTSTKKASVYHGSGIGLSHVRHIVEKELYGKISLLSHHMPTCFAITLPRQKIPDTIVK